MVKKTEKVEKPFAGDDDETDKEQVLSKLLCYRHLDTGMEDLSPASHGCLKRTARARQELGEVLRSIGAERAKPARILCVARRHCRKGKYVDFVGEYHLDLVQNYGGAMIIVPRTAGTLRSLAEYMPMDGLLVVEGNDLSDTVLAQYGFAAPPRLTEEEATKYAGDTEFDIEKDELEFALMKYALDIGCPILSLCRGAQMLNVLHGGSLYGDVAAEVGVEIEHLKDSSDPNYDSHRHPIRVEPSTPLASWFEASLSPERELLVNSYHHQAVKKLAERFRPMAFAPDGLLEAFYDPSYDPERGNFVVGLQFHPERMLSDYPGCCRPYEDFLKACRSFKLGQEASFACRR